MEETPKMGTTKIIEVIRHVFHVESNGFGDTPYHYKEIHYIHTHIQIHYSA